MSSIRYSIAGREFDLKSIDTAEREQVRELAFQIVTWVDEQPWEDVMHGCLLPPHLAAGAWNGLFA